MTQIKKSGTTPGAAKKYTYYDGYAVTDTYVSDQGDGRRLASALFTGPRGDAYEVNTHTWYDKYGKNRRVSERGTRNGVTVDITTDYGGPDDLSQGSDTTYNGLQRGDIGFELLQRQFEDNTYKPTYQDPPIKPISRLRRILNYLNLF